LIIDAKLAFMAELSFSRFLSRLLSISSLCSGIFYQNSDFGGSAISPLLSLPFLFSSMQAALDEVIKSGRIHTQSIELRGFLRPSPSVNLAV
jgi:hypothetical protein